MTYYEVTTVKKYKRKNNKDSTQINLGVNSKFAKDTRVVVIAEDDFNTLTSNNDVDLKKELDEMRAKFEEINSQNSNIDDLKNQLLNEKEEKEKLLITLATNERSIKDKDVLIASKDSAITTFEKEIETKDGAISNYENELESNKTTISNYENDIKDKDNIIETLTQNWVWYKRIFNILPSNINLDNAEDE